MVINMNIMKIDKEKIMNAIDTFKENSGRQPYIICNKETYENLKKDSQNETRITAPGNLTWDGSAKPQPPKSICIDGTEYVPKGNQHLAIWQGSKVIIDPDLKYGEMIIG